MLFISQLPIRPFLYTNTIYEAISDKRFLASKRHSRAVNLGNWIIQDPSPPAVGISKSLLVKNNWHRKRSALKVEHSESQWEEGREGSTFHICVGLFTLERGCFVCDIVQHPLMFPIESARHERGRRTRGRGWRRNGPRRDVRRIYAHKMYACYFFLSKLKYPNIQGGGNVTLTPCFFSHSKNRLAPSRPGSRNQLPFQRDPSWSMVQIFDSGGEHRQRLAVSLAAWSNYLRSTGTATKFVPVQRSTKVEPEDSSCHRYYDGFSVKAVFLTTKILRLIRKMALIRGSQPLILRSLGGGHSVVMGATTALKECYDFNLELSLGSLCPWTAATKGI